MSLVREANMIEKQSLTRDFIDDFEIQSGLALSSQCKKELVARQQSLAVRFCVDFMICQFILGPLVIAFWRGTWDYVLLRVDHDLLQNHCGLSNIIFLSLGLSVSFCLQLAQHSIKDTLAGATSGAWRFMAISRVFSVVLGLFDIYYWKGLWDGINCVIELKWYISLATFLIGSIGLIILGTYRSIISAPLGTVVDSFENCCQTATYLGSSARDHWARRSMDIALSLFCEGLCILAWHGIWTMEDFLMEGTITDLESFFMGSGLSLLLFFIQFPVLRVFLSNNVSNVVKRLIQVFMAFASGTATVTMFRAYWKFMDTHYLPEHYEISLLTGQAFGALLLMLTSSSCSLTPGIVRDAPNPRDGYILPYHYLTFFFIQDVNAKTEGGGEQSHKPRHISSA